ncbi:MAG: tRNA pseudouridine(13) synthase TruD [Gammaproteobacteria bacterium]|nr:MAG: tRNA pseudouridine(13) synthase TruD [Gammaproteobacteria bacterium]
MNHRQFSLDFPYALGKPPALAGFREQLEDFQVIEELGFELSGEGEHLSLYVQKKDQNTRWVAGLLADALGVDEMAVGYCGLKDRRAVTRQWFSVHLPDAGDLSIPDVPGCDILAVSRHHKKLRRGMHSGNHFVIRLRDVQGDPVELETRLKDINSKGVPNYFGEQRFGRDAGNLPEADQLMQARSAQGNRRRKKTGKAASKDGLYLSAARSYLFNLVLAERVRLGSWQVTLEGEVEPGGPLWGRGRSQVPEGVGQLESRVLEPWGDWCHGLEFSGLSQERRSLVLLPKTFSWRWLQGAELNVRDLELSFFLPSGCFATSLLREVAQLQHSRAVAE